MSGYLLYVGLKWLKNADNFDVNSINENSSTGYILKVDRTTCIAQWLSISSKENLEFLLMCCQIIVKICRWMWNKSWWC